jgi:hypothetical protein
LFLDKSDKLNIVSENKVKCNPPGEKLCKEGRNNCESGRCTCGFPGNPGDTESPSLQKT